MIKKKFFQFQYMRIRIFIINKVIMKFKKNYEIKFISWWYDSS